jgi:hypothetical protein
MSSATDAFALDLLHGSVAVPAKGLRTYITTARDITRGFLLDLEKLQDVPISTPPGTTLNDSSDTADPTSQTGLLQPRTGEAPKEGPIDWTASQLGEWVKKALRNYQKAILAVDPDAGSFPAARLVTEIESLSQLSQDWDTRGARAVDSMASANAESFAWQLGSTARFFEPFADPDGSVGIEGHSGTTEIYLNFAPGGEIAYVVKTASGVHRGYGADIGFIRRLFDVVL